MAPSTRRLNPSDALPVDRLLWKACAGPSVQLPPVRSLVYYFPQGHADHADGQHPVVFSPRVYSTPSVRCRVLSVEYLARPDTEEVFAKLRMMPVRDDDVDGHMDDEEEDEKSVQAFAKVLTSSDANNGGGFSMPKKCAEILPKLDFQADFPAQKLSMFDLHGKVWEFRHIFRGKPLRHLLTTGWSLFVNSKKLIHGDSVVFIRDERSKTLFICVRRGISPSSVGNWTMGSDLQPVQESPMIEFGNDFSRRLLGKVPKEEVIEAAERAVNGEEFEIDYYPGGGFSNVVVNADLVHRTWRFPWSLNVKVKMKMEIGEPRRVAVVRGTVVALSGYDTSGLWDVKSPWRMLKIHWDHPEVTKDDEWISPWELEIDNPLEPLDMQRIPETASTVAAAPPRFKQNLTQNTRCARIEGVRDDEPATNVPSSGAPVDVEAAGDVIDAAQNENINSAPGPAIQGNNAHDMGSFRLFGKVISYGRRRLDRYATI